MVKPFRFARVPLILFGNGGIKDLPVLIIKRYGQNVVLVTGKKSFTGSEYSESLFSELQSHGINIHHYIVDREPTPEIIDEASSRFRNMAPDLIVAIGGGSVIDAGKAISGMLTVTGSVVDYLEGVGSREHPGSKIPFIAVPTTSGTGSEATKNAVILRTGKKGFKKSLRHDNFVPDIAVIDPLLTTHCPPDLTAASGMDCFTQLTEAYLSDNASTYTDSLSWEGLKAVKSSLLTCLEDGSDIEARADMSFAALTSGICLANAGLGAVHGFASSMGGMFDIPHGIICGNLMAAANTVTVKVLRNSEPYHKALHKYARLGMLFLDEEDRSDDFYIDGFLNYLNRITSESGIPGFKKFGVTRNDINEICRNTDIKNNPAKLDFQDLTEILQLCI